MADTAGDKTTEAAKQDEKASDERADEEEQVKEEKLSQEDAMDVSEPGSSQGGEEEKAGPSKEQLESGDTTDSQGSKSDANTLHCYCCKGRNIGSLELQCWVCLRWYHSECVSCSLGNNIPFMMNYYFCCKNCSQNGMENFYRKQASFSQMCHTAVANLTHQALQRGDMRPMFYKESDIVPYIEKYWEALTTMPRRVKQTWHTTILKTMMKDNEIFTYNDSPDDGDTLFGLQSLDLSKIGPFSHDQGGRQGYAQGPSGKSGGHVSEKTTRGTKRRVQDNQLNFGSKQKKGETNLLSKLPPHGYPIEHPFNKDGYRYILAEPDPHAPNRQAFDESTEWAGKPIPGYLYRKFLSSEVLLALHDRAPQLKVSEDRLTVTGEKGYSMIRATHGVNCGAWYFEVKIDEFTSDSEFPAATRIGWSQAMGNLQGPCGYDKFSYSWRSRKGTAFHESKGRHYHDGGYGVGDVLGMYIYMPPPSDPSNWLPHTYKDRPLVKFKSHLYYEEKDAPDTEKNLRPAEGSKIVFVKNGEICGEAFTDIYEAVYYPAISLYKNAQVTVNFGPEFKFPPPEELGEARPMSEAASQAMVECALADVLYHVEHEGKLPDFL